MEWDRICKFIGKPVMLQEGVNRTNFEGPEKFKKFYNEGMKRRVYELYQADFINFSYDADF
jgi:hypothetical protein